MADGGINPVRKTVCMIDLDGDEDIQADAIELYGLSKDHGWLLMMKIEADQFSFDPKSEFYHRVFKVVKSGQVSQVNDSPDKRPLE